jgi:hypothetical protein
MPNMFDRLVRVAALLLACIFLLTFYSHTANGRFQMHSAGGGSQIILDTRSGAVYRAAGGKLVKMENEREGGTITVDESEVTPVEHK